MKKTIILLVASLLLFATSILVRELFEENRHPTIEVEPIEKERFRKLRDILANSPYFKDSSFTEKDSHQTMIVDGTYDISIKPSSYSMTIKDDKPEETYCQIVDAIEMNLGAKEGASLETCRETLRGSIDLGGISAEIFDNYKVLTVKSDEPAKLYNREISHAFKDIISIDEEEYIIEEDDYIFTSMRTQYASSTKTYSICGHLFNPQKNTGSFTFTIYDDQKNPIGTKDYEYIKDTKKYKTFCVDFTLDQDSVKYYGVGGK